MRNWLKNNDCEVFPPSCKELPVFLTNFLLYSLRGAKNFSWTVRVSQLQDAFNRLIQATKLCPLFTTEM